MELMDKDDEELGAVEVAHHQDDQVIEDEERQYVDSVMDAHSRAAQHDAATAIQQENPMLAYAASMSLFDEPANIAGEKYCCKRFSKAFCPDTRFAGKFIEYRRSRPHYRQARKWS